MTTEPEVSQDALQIARIVRTSCINAARKGYENAEISGLCGEGALEAAISAIEMLNLEFLLAKQPIK